MFDAVSGAYHGHRATSVGRGIGLDFAAPLANRAHTVHGVLITMSHTYRTRNRNGQSTALLMPTRGPTITP